MLNWIINIFRGDRNFGGRHKDWGKVRKRHISTYPMCSVCGKKKTFRNNDVHHIIPFQVDSFKELDMDNLLTLCRDHHLLFGHLNYWKSWNTNVKEDSRYFNIKIFQRP